MITWKYLNAESTQVGKFVNGVNVGGGSVADAEFKEWLSEGNTPEPYVTTPAELNAPIYAEIAAVESKQNRVVREALLNQAGAADRLTAIDAQIAALRAQLV